jgi:hypothetical protein
MFRERFGNLKRRIRGINETNTPPSDAHYDATFFGVVPPTTSSCRSVSESDPSKTKYVSSCYGRTHKKFSLHRTGLWLSQRQQQTINSPLSTTDGSSCNHDEMSMVEGSSISTSSAAIDSPWKKGKTI